MAEVVAGHTFGETPVGRACVSLNYQGEPCFCRWLTIRDSSIKDLSRFGIAHQGQLTEIELNQIVAERTREENAVWNAVVACAFPTHAPSGPTPEADEAQDLFDL